MPMVTISISPEQVAHLRIAVESGAYASDSEAVRDALVMWCEARRRQGLPAMPPGRVMGHNRHVGKEGKDVAHLSVGDMLGAHNPGTAHG
ncbi:type II toxin-antitoxin system ParD family antitoxin [Rhizobiaceae bacterium BDR2-2]|uniref:Type II toxin-antitoxin system ParD family antitoxin n=1 Tax=Ectorhizobium quercum TaxID=2965071 RepID=A0AAE3SXI6_9HYPH|nr:type II toxin-antitoxin system ParD family antitoxin [Ectorhizobium quercum]MCX8998545.1 type II toxin-antitoxin system ParD family antitoxin [Ectorhizobium quercum]